MASINLIANGVYTDTAIWSTGTVPGPADTVNLNGYVVEINGNWSIANMTDNGLAGSGAYVTTGSTTIDISGTLTSSVVPTATTQQNGAGNSSTKPTLLNYTQPASANVSLTIGQIVGSAAACAVAFLYPSGLNASIGSLTLTGTGVNGVGKNAIGISIYYAQGTSSTITVGNTSVSGEALGVACWNYTLTPNVTVNFTGSATSTSGASLAAGECVINAAQTLTATDGAFVLAGAYNTIPSDMIVNGNISCTGAKASNFNTLVVHGTITMSGTVSGDAGLYAQTHLYADNVVLESGATLTLSPLTVIKNLSGDGTQLYAIGNISPHMPTLLFCGGLNPTIPGVTTYYLPSESQVLSGVDYLNGLVGDLVQPPPSTVINTETYGSPAAPIVGTLTLPSDADVSLGVVYGVGGTGSTGTLVVPAEDTVLIGTVYGIGGNGSTGNVTLPVAADVVNTTTYGPSTAPITGTLVLPAEATVLTGTVYGVGGNGDTGNVVLPIEANVAYGTEYGPNGTSFVGTLGAPPQGGNYCLVSDSYYNPDGSPYVGAVTVEILSLAANWPPGNNMGASMELATNSSGQLMDGTQPFVPLPYGASVQFSWGSITSPPWTVPSTPTATPPSFVGN